MLLLSEVLLSPYHCSHCCCHGCHFHSCCNCECDCHCRCWCCCSRRWCWCCRSLCYLIFICLLTRRYRRSRLSPSDHPRGVSPAAISFALHSNNHSWLLSLISRAQASFPEPALLTKLSTSPTNQLPTFQYQPIRSLGFSRNQFNGFTIKFYFSWQIVDKVQIKLWNFSRLVQSHDHMVFYFSLRHRAEPWFIYCGKSVQSILKIHHRQWVPNLRLQESTHLFFKNDFISFGFI